MKETKFTKGEWIACTHDNHDIQVTFFGVVFGGCYHQLGSGIENKFNAHLIAAAPEMYEMLESLADRDECQMFKVEIAKLLAKARGEL